MREGVREVPPRLGALSAWAAVGAWIVLYLVAAAATPTYTVTGNRLSDLGNPAAGAPWAFDAACIAAGLLFLPFTRAIGAGMSKWMKLPGRTLMAAAVLALIGVGVFPEGSPYDLHFIMSALFFVLFMMAISHFAVAMWRNPRYGRLSGALGVVASGLALFFIVAVVVESVGNGQIAGGVVANVLEHVTVFAGLAWAAWNGWRLYRMGAG